MKREIAAPNMNPEAERETLNLWPEFARVLGIGKNGIYQAAKRGDFRVIRVGKRILVSKSEADRLLNARTHEGEA